MAFTAIPGNVNSRAANIEPGLGSSLTSTAAVRVSQVGLLAVTQGIPAVRVSQEGLLAVVQGNPKVRISQEGLLAIVTLRSGKIIKVPLNALNVGSDFSGGMS